MTQDGAEQHTTKATQEADQRDQRTQRARSGMERDDRERPQARRDSGSGPRGGRGGDRFVRNDRPQQNNRTNRSNRTVRDDRTDQGAGESRGYRSSQGERTNRKDGFGRRDRSGQEERGYQSGRDGRGGRGGQDRDRGGFRSEHGAGRGSAQSAGGWQGRAPRRDADGGRGTGPSRGVGGGGTGYGRSRPPQSSQERLTRRDEPALPDSITGAELDKHVRGQLSTLSTDNGLMVAKHLIAAGMFLDEDPERAYAHAMAAQNRAGRIAVVREAAGFAAYHTGRYDEALREFRTVRRLTGSNEHLPLMADCERGRGKPEQAIELASSAQAQELDRAGQLELLMVASGARRDMGQPGAGALLLQVPELTGAVKPSLVDTRARLLLAYSEALADDSRADEAEMWRRRAHANDPNGILDDASSLGEDDDATFTDLEDADE